MAASTLYAFLAYFPLMMIANGVEVRALRDRPAGGAKSAWFEVLMGFATLAAVLGAFFTLNALLGPEIASPDDAMQSEVATFNATVIWIAAYGATFGAAGLAFASLFEWLNHRRKGDHSTSAVEDE